jgi:hypothetical protein
MSTHDKATSDNTYPSRPAAQQKQGSSITDKIGGAVDVIHGRLTYRQVRLLHYNSNVSS